MKKFVFGTLISGWFLVFPFLLNAREVSVNTKIVHVTLYRSGAEITREGVVTLPAGRHQLLFRGLSSEINEGSIRVGGEGGFTILSVKKGVNFLASREMNPEWKALDERLRKLRHERELLNVRMEVVKGEISMLEKNQQVAGQNGLNLTDLSNALAYFEKKMSVLKTEQMEVAEKIKKKDEEIAQVKKQMDQLSGRQKNAAGEILVSVEAQAPVKGKMRISYYTPRAGWTPGYDVRVHDLKGDVRILYKAYVTQTTGEVWDQIPLTISTGDPRRGGNKPELRPWYLDYVQEVRYKVMPVQKGRTAVFEEAPASALPVTQRSALTTTLYNISMPVTIYPDKRGETVLLRDLSLPATYAYYAVPKLSPRAFLTAAVTGWKEHELLSGKMNLFLEGAFVGNAYLDASVPEDTLHLTLGQDERIRIQREKIEDMTRRKSLGGSVVESHAWKITVMNGKPVAVHLFVEDQIPVSTQKDIVVEPEELSGARLDRQTGKCTWDLQLAPGEKKSLTLRFSVKYPKGKRITL